MERPYYQDYANWERTHWWFAARRQILRRLLERSLSGRNLRMLDVGCATGGNGQILACYGHLLGMDKNPSVASYLPEKGYQGFVVSGLEAIGARSNSFDLVTALDIVEHVDDDLAAIKELARISKLGGIVLITVPAFSFLWGQQDDISHHRRRYTRVSLKAVTAAAGLDIQKLSYFNTFLFPCVTAVRLVRRLRRSVPGRLQSDFVLFESGLPNKILAWVFSLEAFILSWLNLPFGVSLVCIATKGRHPQHIGGDPLTTSR